MLKFYAPMVVLQIAYLWLWVSGHILQPKVKILKPPGASGSTKACSGFWVSGHKLRHKVKILNHRKPMLRLCTPTVALQMFFTVLGMPLKYYYTVTTFYISNLYVSLIRDPFEPFPVSASLGDSSSLCESLQTSWPHLTTLTITDVSVGDAEARKILQTCLQRAANQQNMDRMMWVYSYIS